MHISYDSYRIFYYVARYGSLSQAARLLLSSQPNLTRAIRSLEGELGCTLFLRTSRGMKLTPEGEALYAHIRVAAAHIEAAEEELGRSRGGGTVTVKYPLSVRGRTSAFRWAHCSRSARSCPLFVSFTTTIEASLCPFFDIFFGKHG